MIDRVRGRLLEVRPGGVVLEVGGLGLWIAVPPGSLALEADEELQLYTHLHVREDALELYGFATPQERELFRLLIGIAGVGPKVALSVLGHLPPARLQAAVLSQDAAALRQVKGIGPKVAERLLVELRGKLDGLELGPAGPAAGGASSRAAFLALTQTLGFGAHEARRALEAVQDEGDSAEVLVQKALKWLSGGA